MQLGTLFKHGTPTDIVLQFMNKQMLWAKAQCTKKLQTMQVDDTVLLVDQVLD